MILALTARRVSAGKAAEFIEQFGGTEPMPDEVREKFRAIYASVDVKDPDVVLTIGLFDGTLDELRGLQGSDARAERLGNVDPLIEEILVDGSFEVAREFVAEAVKAKTDEQSS
jgi:hypothetical protein